MRSEDGFEVYLILLEAINLLLLFPRVLFSSGHNVISRQDSNFTEGQDWETQ